MNFVALFFAGVFLVNAVPHLTAGLRGEIFPSPFARPPGRGPTSPLVNFLWGGLNLVVGLLLLGLYPVAIGLNLDCAALLLGGLLMGVRLATHFGRVRAEGTINGRGDA